MPTILITGAGGFVGSHAVEYFSGKGWNIKALDNLSRAKILGKPSRNARYNWEHIGRIPNVELIEKSILDFETVKKAASDVDAIMHCAAQTAVTTSVIDPRTDFETNAQGTFNVLEAARQSGNNPSISYCSTNKVFGENVNGIPVVEKEKRYAFDSEHSDGISETFSIDSKEHTPYGCSKLAGDLYVQDYGQLYGLRTGVFRMSCIYGTRQFGLEDQGWVAWFAIAAITGKPVTIFGDGKQVRDVLYVTDLVKAHASFLESKHKSDVFTTGGGKENTLSLLELLEILEEKLGKKIPVSFSDWRPSDQKVYISDTRKLRKELGWKPEVSAREGVSKLFEWAKENKHIF
ncbi:MAG: GDP-mannose 4,6-dehydratase [Candidatus Diapherotrites archaeon]